MATAAARAKEVLSFGPFKLHVYERLLTKDGIPLELGSRALEILIVLTSTPNEVVSKNEVMSRVWPDVIVEEANLRTQMAILRKALGDGRDGARYITTIPGRGYCWVAPVSAAGTPDGDMPTAAANFSRTNLPARLSRMVGRDDDVLKLSAKLNASRLVTIVGAGGIGKTTVAVDVSHRLADVFAGSVIFVDLGMLSDPKLVATALASMLGLSVQSDDATPSLIAFLKNRRILLILDTCEHLVEAVAVMAQRIMQAAPQVHILATSREALRIEGESVYRLDALACPSDVPGLTAAALRQYPATRLFVECSVASGAGLNISDGEAPIVASICRRLDGVALAIELVARRVDSYGLQQTAALLDQRMTLLGLGSRTAPPRQKTLQATLDWSYELLSELERLMLRRLAVFVGHFTLDAALEVLTSTTLDPSTVIDAIDSLVAKSMVASRPIGAMMSYRLLDATRAYALDISIEAAEVADLAVRHAAYYRRWLMQTGTEWSTSSTEAERVLHFTALNNVRAALEWCFGPNGSVEIGVGLAAAAAPVFLAMSLLTECYRWSECAILALDAATRGGLEEMHLQAGLGISSMHMHGENDTARGALYRSLAIAEERCDVLHQVGLLGMLHVFHFRGGDFNTALGYARRNRTLVDTVEDPAALALAHSILGRSLYFMGDLSGARLELEASLPHWSSSRQTTIYLAYDSHYRAGIALARTLWLLGHPAQGLERARQAIESAAHMDHPASLAVVLGSAASIFLWSGDLHSAEECAGSLVSHAESHSLGPLLAVGRAFKAVLIICRGDTKDGVESLQASLAKIRALRYELLTTEFEIPLVEGLAAVGRFAEGITLVDEAIRRVETNGDMLYMPELLRVKAGLLLSMPQPSVGDAEMYLMRSLELSRRQAARAWELRAGIDLAALWATQRRPDRAKALLQPIFQQFVEGLDTADLKAAEELLETLV